LTKDANPLIWGAVCALIAALIVVAATAAGTVQPDNPLLDNPLKAAGAAFAWGVGIAFFRNWWVKRR
jgi:hypothetical protein